MSRRGTRAAKVAEAQRLRAQGLLYREIAERLGVSPSTVAQYITDPDMSRARARKDRLYGGHVCSDCGESLGMVSSPAELERRKRAGMRCRNCIEWSPEALLAAVREYADENGGIPPTQAAWERGHDRDRWPHPGTAAKKHFGSWNGLLIAAGFGLHCDRQAETAEAIERMYRDGKALDEIAGWHGTSPGNIRQRLIWAGVLKPKRGPARAEREATIARCWRAGASYEEIAEALDSTPASIQVAVSRMRHDGWDMPRRRTQREAA